MRAKEKREHTKNDKEKNDMMQGPQNRGKRHDEQPGHSCSVLGLGSDGCQRYYITIDIISHQTNYHYRLTRQETRFCFLFTGIYEGTIPDPTGSKWVLVVQRKN